MNECILIERLVSALCRCHGAIGRIHRAYMQLDFEDSRCDRCAASVFFFSSAVLGSNIEKKNADTSLNNLNKRVYVSKIYVTEFDSKQ